MTPLFPAVRHALDVLGISPPGHRDTEAEAAAKLTAWTALRDALASAELAMANPDPAPEPPPHHYLSTGCYHGDHDYCRSMTGLAGAKRPAECKFCGAPCQCSCHAPGETGELLPADDMCARCGGPAPGAVAAEMDVCEACDEALREGQ